jgi:hypothetical protein
MTLLLLRQVYHEAVVVNRIRLASSSSSSQRQQHQQQQQNISNNTKTRMVELSSAVFLASNKQKKGLQNTTYKSLMTEVLETNMVNVSINLPADVSSSLSQQEVPNSTTDIMSAPFTHGVDQDQHLNVTLTLGTSILYNDSQTTSLDASLPQLQDQQVLNHTTIEATLRELLSTNRLNLSQVPFIFPKPPVDSYDISSIYSKSAWLELRNMFNRSEQVTICVNGGSSAAGSGDVMPYDRFHYLFAKVFRNATIVDRAHGARNSLHSVHMMHSFLPQHTDIILWEFSLNDEVYHQTRNETIRFTEAQNQYILWLEEVIRVSRRRHQARPPLVIMVYL